MKKQIKYRTFYLIGRIVGIGVLYSLLIGCNKSPNRETPLLDTLNDVVESAPISIDSENKSNTDSFFYQIDTTNNNPDYQEFKAKILKRKQYELKIQKIEVKIDSVSDKWENIEKVIREKGK